MRGNKRRAAPVGTAANRPQPALHDSVLDVVNRKGMRCCVECGATSTPQWREGPMGPKTLCNACGVRRQRLLRKQQAASVGNAPTAPVAAVQARRRMTSRPLEAPALLESEEVPYGAPSGSEHSSDETEVAWATAATPFIHANLHQSIPSRLLHHQFHELLKEDVEQLHAQHDIEESYNEDESAAYDLLFFAGVECGGGQCGGSQSGSGAWRSEEHYSNHGHGHNTRRHAYPVHRSDDFYYDDQDGEVGADDETSTKRRRLTAPPRPRRHRSQQPTHAWHATVAGASCLSPSEDAVDSELAFKLAVESVDVARQELLIERDEYHGKLQQQRSVAVSAGALLPPSPFYGGSPKSRPTMSTIGSTVGLALPSALVPHPMLSLPLALPVMPLSMQLQSSLSLPSSMPVRDLDILAKLQLEFQRACLQLHQANIACEAVSTVVAERRQEAATAHEHAAAASQQLAVEAQALADRIRLRDVLAELHFATAKDSSAASVPAAAAAEVTATKEHRQPLASTPLSLQPQLIK